MTKIAVHGCNGKIGELVTKTLLDLDHIVYGYDNIPKTKIEHENFYHNCSSQNDIKIAIGCVPHNSALKIANRYISKKIPYFDISGNTTTDEEINILAESMGGTTFTGLGLAPGWIGIEAVNLIRKYRPKQIKMYVGGLPSDPNPLDPIKWMPTWNIAGLIDNYKNKSEIIKYGQLEKISSCRETEEKWVKDSFYEAAHTSGGVSHVLDYAQKMGVQFAAYKTLRYKGHFKIINHLVNKCRLSNEILERILCAYPYKEDKVLMRIDTISAQGCSWSWSRKIEAKDGYSAMQRSTALPLCSIVQNFIDKKLPIRYKFTYEDVNINDFHSVLDRLLDD